MHYCSSPLFPSRRFRLPKKIISSCSLLACTLSENERIISRWVCDKRWNFSTENPVIYGKEKKRFPPVFAHIVFPVNEHWMHSSLSSELRMDPTHRAFIQLSIWHNCLPLFRYFSHAYCYVYVLLGKIYPRSK